MNRRGFLKTLGVAVAGVAAGLALPEGVASPLYIPSERLAYGVPRLPLSLTDDVNRLVMLEGRPEGSMIYEAFKESVLSGEVDLSRDTIKIALLDNNFTEVSGVGYARQPVSNIFGPADDVAWENSTIRARHAFLYAEGTPVVLINFGSDQWSTGGTFTISWDKRGIIGFPDEDMVWS